MKKVTKYEEMLGRKQLWLNILNEYYEADEDLDFDFDDDYDDDENFCESYRLAEFLASRKDVQIV